MASLPIFTSGRISHGIQAAEAALKAGENYLSTRPPLPPIIDCNIVGLYPNPLPVVGCEALDVLIPLAQNEAVWRDTFPLSFQHDVDGSDSTIDLVSINANPRYIIEDLGPPIVCPEYSLPAYVGLPFVARPDCNTYRITARATGSSSTSVVMVESIFDYGNSVAIANDIAGGIVAPNIPPPVTGVRRSWRQLR
jgi:Tfp pilus assembly protein PilX